MVKIIFEANFLYEINDDKFETMIIILTIDCIVFFLEQCLLVNVCFQWSNNSTKPK